MLKRIVHVVGARPYFMKIAPIMEEMDRFPDRFQQTLVHTGQHYDQEMSQIFFDDLGLPEPDIYLNVGSDTHAKQTAEIMIRFEEVLLGEQPDLVIVVGDVNSTIACALVASKLHVPVAHEEAGLRSYDRYMPEEVNRVLMDQISDLLFVTEKDALRNLEKEGIDSKKVHFVGNVMIDILMKQLEKALSLETYKDFGLEQNNYVLLTLHPSSNIDDSQALNGILIALHEIQKNIKIIFPA